MDKLTVGQVGGTAALTAAGAGAGLAIGAKKASNIISSNLKLAGMTKDAFVANKVDKQMENIISSNLSRSDRISAFNRIREGAAKKFDSLAKIPETFISQAKNTKIKWVAGLAAAGLAIGAVGSFVASKVAANKAEPKEA